MNIFSNIGITELIFILVLALLVVGPERLPEMARSLAKGLRDLRRAYENLTKDLGPELMSIQQTTQELRESVDAVRSIPRDAVQSVVKAADLEETTKDLKTLTQDMGKIGQAIRDPIGAAASEARDALKPPAAPPDGKGTASATGAALPMEPPQPFAAAEPNSIEPGPAPEEPADPDRQKTPAEEADPRRSDTLEELAND